MQERVPGGVQVDWRYFSLEQVNQRAGEGVNVWERPAGYDSTGMSAFAASEWVRRQGNSELWERFHAGLLEVRHTGKKERLTPAVVERVAEGVGVDVARLRREVENAALLAPVAEQHAAAVKEGVFGTPTLIFENGLSGYLKMLPAPTGDEAVRAWTHLRSLIEGCAYIAEVKRPQKPKTA